MSRLAVFLAGFLIIHKLALADDWLYETQSKLVVGGSLYESSSNPNLENAYPVLRYDVDMVAWEGGNEVVFHPIIQYAPDDDDEYYGDIRELSWRHEGERQTLTAGLQQFFWGSLESANPINILNQIDFHTGLEKYDRLGMPALSLDQRTELGSLTLILLTGFREREFPEAPSRPNLPFTVNDEALYESSRKERRLDLALRWYGLLGQADVGVSLFSGTRRTPSLLYDSGTLTPFYPLTHFVGTDISYANGNWLWKMEAITGYEQDRSYQTTGVGAEYTLIGLFGTRWDLGLIAEGYFDSRDDEAPGWWQNDIAVGARFGANNVSGSELKLLVSNDWTYDSRQAKLEFSTRLGEQWQLNVLGYWADAEPTDKALSLLSDDNHINVTLSYYLQP